MRILLPLAILALLAAALFLYLRTEAESALPPGRAGASETVAQSSEVASPVSALPADAAPTAERVASPSAVAPDAPSGSEEGVEVLVLDQTRDASGARVAGATVRALPFVYAMRFAEEHPSQTLDVEDTTTGVVEVVTDAMGRARLPRHVFPGQCSARKGSLYGMRWLQANEVDAKGHTPLIVIAADRSFVLRVIDGNGRPVEGVPVALSPAGAEMEEETIWTGLTRGPEGLAVVRHVDQLVARYGPRTMLSARTAILAREGEVLEARVDVDMLPVEPVKLILPPCGSVEVLLRGPSGEPAHSRQVELADASELDEHGSLPFEARSFPPARLERGRAVFPFVGIGLQLHVRALGGSGLSERKIGPGPTRDGERVTFTLQFDEEMPRFSGRVLLPGDRPFALRTLQLTLQGTFGRSSPPVATDGEGRFEFWSPVSAPMLARSVLRVGAQEGELTLHADVVLPEPIPRGDIDLGDLRLAAPVVLARGRVLDDQGAPVVGALLGVQSESLVHGPGSWVGEMRVQVVHADAGAFELHGDWAGGRLRLTASRAGYSAAPPVEFTLPCGELRIVLQRAAAILGRVLLDDGVLPADLRIRVVRREALAPEIARVEGGQGASLTADGSFAIEDVRPGRVDLAFALRNDPKPFFVLEDLVLLPGERAADGRLTAIDLRGRVPTASRPR